MSSEASRDPPDDTAAPARRSSPDRLLAALADAGGRRVRPSDLGERAGLGHTARSEWLGQLRLAGLVEGTIHEVSLTAAGWELARRRQGLAQPPPEARGDAPAVPALAAAPPEPVVDDSSSKDPGAHDPAPVAVRPAIPPGDAPVDVVRTAPSPEPVPRSSPEDGASDVWGWMFLAGTVGAVLLWRRSRAGGAAGAVRPAAGEGLSSAAEGPAPAPEALQAPRATTEVPDYVVRAQRLLDGRP